METRPTARRRQLAGKVVSVGKMAKTVTVAVERYPWHPRVRKQIRRTKHFLVHDPAGEARVGDRVVIEESRPISKRKHMRILRVETRNEKRDARTRPTAEPITE